MRGTASHCNNVTHATVLLHNFALADVSSAAAAAAAGETTALPHAEVAHQHNVAHESNVAQQNPVAHQNTVAHQNNVAQDAKVVRDVTSTVRVSAPAPWDKTDTAVAYAAAFPQLDRTVQQSSGPTAQRAAAASAYDVQLTAANLRLAAELLTTEAVQPSRRQSVHAQSALERQACATKPAVVLCHAPRDPREFVMRWAADVAKATVSATEASTLACHLVAQSAA